MEKSHSLLKKLQKVVPSRITGLYFRLVSSKRESEILSTQGSFAYGGRYNPPGEFGVLYLGETKDVCEAERDRKTDSSLLAPQVMGKVRASCEKVLDLTDPKTLKKLGVRKEEILREERDGGWDLTWNISRLAYKLGFKAIRAPSITGRGNILIVFDKYLTGEKIKIVSRTQV